MTKLKTLIIDEKSREEIIGNGGAGPSRISRIQCDLPRDPRPYKRQSEVVDDTGSPSTLRMLAGRLTSAIRDFLPVRLFESSSVESVSSSATAQIIEEKTADIVDVVIEDEEERVEEQSKKSAFKRLAKFFHDKRMKVGSATELSPEDLQDVMDLVNSTRPARPLTMRNICNKRHIDGGRALDMPARTVSVVPSGRHGPNMAGNGRLWYNFRRAPKVPPMPEATLVNLPPAPFTQILADRHQEEGLNRASNVELMESHARDMQEALNNPPADLTPASSPTKPSTIATGKEVEEPSTRKRKPPRLAYPLPVGGVGGVYLCDTDEEEELLELERRAEERKRRQAAKRAEREAKWKEEKEREANRKAEKEALERETEEVEKKPLFDFGAPSTVPSTTPSTAPSTAPKASPTKITLQPLQTKQPEPEAPKKQPSFAFEFPSATTKLPMKQQEEPKRKRSFDDEKASQPTQPLKLSLPSQLSQQPAEMETPKDSSQQKLQEQWAAYRSTLNIAAPATTSETLKEPVKFTFGLPKTTAEPKAAETVTELKAAEPITEPKNEAKAKESKPPTGTTKFEIPTSFKFGTGPSTTTNNAATTPAVVEPLKFTFNASQTPVAEEPKKNEPLKFTFGAPQTVVSEEPKKVEPIKFSFGTPAPSQPAASAQPATSAVVEAPKFNFPTQPSVPAASIQTAATVQTPAPKPFAFGTQQPAQVTSPVLEQPVQSAFKFGSQQSTQQQQATSPIQAPTPFVFGSQQPSQPQQQQPLQPQQPEAPKPFVFGSQQPKPDTFGFPQASMYGSSTVGQTSFDATPKAPTITPTPIQTPITQTFGTPYYQNQPNYQHFYSQGQQQQQPFGFNQMQQQQQESQDTDMMDDNDQGNDMMDSSAAQVLSGFNAFGSQASHQPFGSQQPSSTQFGGFGSNQQSQFGSQPTQPTPFQFQSQPSASPAPFAFGSQPQSQPQSFPFGQSSNQQPFGFSSGSQPQSQQSQFGANTQSQFQFGASNSQPQFGSTTQSQFGAPTSQPFGVSNQQPQFGATNTAPAAFGSAPSPAFGAPAPQQQAGGPEFSMGTSDRKISVPVSRRRR